jgi:hypothetical protein
LDEKREALTRISDLLQQIIGQPSALAANAPSQLAAA